MRSVRNLAALAASAVLVTAWAADSPQAECVR